MVSRLCNKAVSSSRRFSFEGFYQAIRMKKQILTELSDETRTIILYEAPHRLIKTLKEIFEYLGTEEYL